MNKSGVYLITMGDYLYIGSAVNLKDRWIRHRYHLKSKKHPNKFLQSVYDKHSNSIAFEVLFYCKKDKVVEIEQYTLDYYFAHFPDRVMNILKMATSSLGLKHTEETRKKISNYHKGRVHTEEHRRNMGNSKKGVPFSDDHKKNLGKARATRKVIFISPSGMEHYTENVCQFAKEHNLHKAHIYELVKGRIKHHKGWTVKEVK